MHLHYCVAYADRITTAPNVLGLPKLLTKIFPTPMLYLVDAITQAWVICSGRAPCTRPCPPALCPQLCGCASKILMQFVKALFYYAQAWCCTKCMYLGPASSPFSPISGIFSLFQEICIVLLQTRPPSDGYHTRPSPSAALRCPPSSIKNVFEMKMTKGKQQNH